MTQNLSAAQQTQLDNRDSSGQWKQKAHGEVDDAGDVLGLGDQDSSNSEEPLSFGEAAQKYHDAFAHSGYVEVRRHHALESSGIPRKDRARLKSPKVTRGFYEGMGRTDMMNVSDSRPGASVYDIETVTAPVSEDEGSITENADGSWSLEDTVTGERWDVRPIDWEEIHHQNVGNPMEITPEREQLRTKLYDRDVERYTEALAADPGSVELRPTADGYEYDQDQLHRAERVTGERQMLVRQSMATAVTDGGRDHVEDSLDSLDVEGRWRVKEALSEMDDPRYADRRANLARAVEAGYGRDSVQVPDKVIEQKLTPGQKIRYKAIDEAGPDAPWREAEVTELKNGGIAYESDLRAAVLTTSGGPSGKSFHRDADGHYIQSTNAGWNGVATVYDFGDGQTAF